MDGQGQWLIPVTKRTKCKFTGLLKQNEAVQGDLKWPGGAEYQGEFRNNARSGHGKFTWRDGISFEGGWRQGLMHGPGKMVKPDGRTKNGIWMDNLPVDATFIRKARTG